MPSISHVYFTITILTDYCTKMAEIPQPPLITCNCNNETQFIPSLEYSRTQKLFHKKVLLRERKRHTVRRAASARIMLRLQTVLDEGRGYPQYSGPGMGYPPVQTWEQGTSPTLTWDGVLPPPPSRCGLTHKVKILPSPILRMRAVKI